MTGQQGSLELEVEETIVSKEIEIKLTNIDKAHMADEAADAQVALTSTETEFKGIKNDYSQRIKKLKAKIETTLEAVNTGVISRNVQCVMKKIYSSNIVQYVYEGEVIEERAMTDQDRQPKLFAPTMEGTELSPEQPQDASADIASVIREEQSSMKEVAF